MKRIKLTQGKFALVDDEDFERVNQFKWYYLKSYRIHGEYGYAVRKVGWNPSEYIFMHNFLIKKKAKLRIDHKDANGLNNQKDNLRLGTPSQNNANMVVRDHTSRYKGVYFHKRSGKWYSCICLNYKKRHLGAFKKEIDAAYAYDIFAKTLFGEFARLNFA